MLAKYDFTSTCMCVCVCPPFCTSHVQVPAHCPRNARLRLQYHAMTCYFPHNTQPVPAASYRASPYHTPRPTSRPTRPATRQHWRRMLAAVFHGIPQCSLFFYRRSMCTALRTPCLGLAGLRCPLLRRCGPCAQPASSRGTGKRLESPCLRASRHLTSHNAYGAHQPACPCKRRPGVHDSQPPCRASPT